jgi:hypothetical protein
VFNPVGLAYGQAERATQQWRDQVPAVLEDLARWKAPDGDSSVAFFAAKCGFFAELAGVVVTPADRAAVTRAMLDFIVRSDLRTAGRMEWFLPLSGLIGTSPALLDELANSPDPVIALYAALEKLAPRSAGKIVPLL